MPRRFRRVELEAAQLEARLLDPVVHRAHFIALETLDRPAVLFRLVDERRQRREHGLRAARDLSIAVRDRDDAAEEGPVLPPLDVKDVAGLVAPFDGIFVDPPEVGAGQVPIPQLQLHAEALEVLRCARRRNRLAAAYFAEHLCAVGQGDLFERARPEEPEAVGQDEREHAADHEEADPEPAAGQPDGGVAALETVAFGHQIALYRSRSRWRMISATVLTTNVMRKSSAAARNSVR